MQVGIISDVHADYATLTEVLDRLDKHHRVDHILCAGDLVGRGPEPERVVALVRAYGVTCVRGNHDDWALSLNGETERYLRGLPLEWRGRLAGKSVFMCHGKPGNNMWGMYRDHLSKTYLKMGAALPESRCAGYGAHAPAAAHGHAARLPGQSRLALHFQMRPLQFKVLWRAGAAGSVVRRV